MLDAAGMTVEGRIGPNAILQMLPVVEAQLGPDALRDLMDRAHVHVPSGDHMIPEGPAARLHQQLRALWPERAAGIAAQAGRGTAEYILAHRIPRLAQVVLRALPAPLAARLLSQAIARNAWTFAGSGRFEALSPWDFVIHDNPIVRGERSAAPLCHWHAAVFETLYRRLVHPAAICRETHCAGNGGSTCQFSLLIPS
ncbi:MAG: bacteriochlorophyll 4-vinyl reductase [Paracoccaceae bacterium]|nr:bacteriochlorophyll 4-vinyl reductase [Paracoccaceae bacterium]